jgi:hypothetical protein
MTPKALQRTAADVAVAIGASFIPGGFSAVLVSTQWTVIKIF